MVRINANSGRNSYGIKDYILDTVDDLKHLNKMESPMGSTAFVIATSQNYMKNSDDEWIEITTKTSSGGGGSGGDDNIFDGGDIDLAEQVTKLTEQVKTLQDTVVMKDGTGATGTWNINISGTIEPREITEDLDDVITSGYYKVGEGVTNSPSETGTFIVVNYSVGENEIRQCALGADSIYIRDYTDTQWSNWNNLKGDTI